MNKLYYGNNLQVLREHIKDETIDLVYLDPPFNSKKYYSMLFKTPKGHESEAQLTAFDDTWRWGQESEIEFQEILRQSNTDVSEMIRSFRAFLGESDMMAYLTIMANRLLELHRVLKPTGSIYLHCDPTANAYLKICLDAIFGPRAFKNNICWKRTTSSSSKAVAKRFGADHDEILFYTKSEDYPFSQSYLPYPEEEIEKRFRKSDSRGRYKDAELATYSEETLERLKREDKLIVNPSGKLRYKIYLDDIEGVLADDVWTDIPPINSQAKERLGYPTQKPLALLERIIKASSKEGDMVLDPFCGCGTAVHAAQKLNREWTGIDITHLAISLIEKRLKEAFPKLGDFFQVEGTPKDFDGARDLALRDKYQFQWWACSLVNAQPFQGKKKGSDGGIDGLIFFQDDPKESKKIIVSVKGGESVGVTMVKDLIATIARERAAIGLFVTLAEPTKPMITEAASAGFYDSPLGMSFPKIQILTIEGLLHNRERASFPDLTRGGLTFKQAKPEGEEGGEQGKLL